MRWEGYIASPFQGETHTILGGEGVRKKKGTPQTQNICKGSQKLSTKIY